MATLGCEPEDMVCALCREVYRSPRFLTGCYHSFCCTCINNQAKVMESKTFTCPVCREETTLPQGGASKLQVNFYFKEEALEEARRMANKNCVKHTESEIDRVCMTCKVAACVRCKKHAKDGHRVHVMSTGEEGLQAQAKQLDHRVTTKRRELLNLQAKTSALSRMLRHQRNLLHAKVEEQFKGNNQRLWALCRKGSERLNQELSLLHKEVTKTEKLVELSRKSHTSRAGPFMAKAAKKIRKRLKTDLDADLTSVSSAPVALPGLECSTHNDISQALSGFLGQAFEFTPPQEESAPPPPASVEDIKIPIKICKPKEIREILSIAPSDEGDTVMVTFRGDPPHLYSSVAVVQVEDGAVVSVDHDTIQARAVCSFQRVRKNMPRQPVVLKASYMGTTLVLSKAEPRMCLCRNMLSEGGGGGGGVSLHALGMRMDLEHQPYGRQVPVTQPEGMALLMQLNDVWDPFSMDTSPDEQLCVIIDGGDNPHHRQAAGSPKGDNHQAAGSPKGDNNHQAAGIPKGENNHQTGDSDVSLQPPASKKRKLEVEEEESEKREEGVECAAEKEEHASADSDDGKHENTITEKKTDATSKCDGEKEKEENNKDSVTEKGEKKKKKKEGEQHIPTNPITQPPVGGVVKLFRRGQSDPVDVYSPAKSSFLPSDVCFVRCLKQKGPSVLIADWHNDEIHLVRVSKDGFKFKGLVLERHGELVKPSALNTDYYGGVWVGCSNGNVLYSPVKE